MAEPPLLTAGFGELQRLEILGIWHTRCVVFMPDHIHLLLTLSAQADLSAAVRLFKGHLTPTLRKIKAAWQPSFYDHHLRDDENAQHVFIYIFLNPYRAQLCAIDAKWPGYYCATEDWAWFGEMTKKDGPEPAWLR
ncbi:MAG: transposase [Opitutae bacterium]